MNRKKFKKSKLNTFITFLVVWESVLKMSCIIYHIILAYLNFFPWPLIPLVVFYLNHLPLTLSDPCISYPILFPVFLSDSLIFHLSFSCHKLILQSIVFLPYLFNRCFISFLYHMTSSFLMLTPCFYNFVWCFKQIHFSVILLLKRFQN